MREANQHGAAGRYDAAIETAERVDGGPAEADALVVRARALTASGRLRRADRAWAQAVRRNPNDWQLHVEWARAIARRGDLRGALRRMSRARELNPRIPGPR